MLIHNVKSVKTCPYFVDCRSKGCHLVFKAKIINSFEQKNANKTFVLTVILNDIVPRSVKVCKI